MMKKKNIIYNNNIVIAFLIKVLLICSMTPNTISFSIAKAALLTTTTVTTTKVTNTDHSLGRRLSSSSSSSSLDILSRYRNTNNHYRCRFRHHRRQQFLKQSVSLLSSVSGGAQETDEGQSSVQKKQQHDATTASTINTNNGKVQQSLVATYSCIGTWILIHFCKLTPVQASSIQGIIGSTILFSSSSSSAVVTPFSISFFCGTFAGMSSHITTLFDATIIGLLCSCVYYIFDTKKIGIGYGGRLGLISYIANIVYSTITWKGINPFSSILSFIQTSIIAYNSPIIILNLITLFFIVRTNYQILLSQKSSISTSNSDNTMSTGETTGTVSSTTKTTKSNSTSPIITMYTTIKNVAQIVMTLILVITTLGISKVTSYLSFGITFLLIYYGSLATTLVSKIKNKSTKGKETTFLFNKVVASSIVGLFGSLIVPSLPFISSTSTSLSSTIAAPIYLGSFIGMTTLQHYNYYNLFIASIVSTCLYHLNLFNGFGGRLGTIAFIGVNLGI